MALGNKDVIHARLTIGQAPAMGSIDIYFHTDRQIATAAPAGLRLHRGWFNDSRGGYRFAVSHESIQPVDCGAMNLSAQVCARRQLRRKKTLKTVALAQKYSWLAERILKRKRSNRLKRKETPDAELDARRARESETPIILADTDSIFQCDAAEMRQRFARFNQPLVVSAELMAFPWRPTAEFDPWPLLTSRRHFRYPNSGLLAGTRRAFIELETALRNMSGFPCCRPLPSDKRCLVGDQACLQAALLTGRVPHALDTAGTLFLNTYGVHRRELSRKAGRIVYRPTGRDPCVLHSNGGRGGLLAKLRWRVPSVAWMVDPTCAPIARCEPDGFCCVNCTNAATTSSWATEQRRMWLASQDFHEAGRTLACS